MLGGLGQLEVCDYSATQITVRCPPNPYPDGLGTCIDGDYRLIVDTNYSSKGYDEFDLTIGAVGPVGPEGLPGQQGPEGKQGPIGLTGIRGYILGTAW